MWKTNDTKYNVYIITVKLRNILCNIIQLMTFNEVDIQGFINPIILYLSRPAVEVNILFLG